MIEPPASCGEGIAGNAELAVHLAHVAGGMAAVLEAHLPMIDEDDPVNAGEIATYQHLVARYRSIEELAARVGEDMKLAASLPMGRHLDAPGVIGGMQSAFARLLKAETECATYLSDRLAGDKVMMDHISAAAAEEQGAHHDGAP